MYPLDNAYGPWPASGEIDVAEWWSVDPTLVMPSLHFYGRDFHVDSGWGCRVANPSVFHTYTVEWFPTGFNFSIDGTPCFTRTPTPNEPLVAPQPFDQPFSMILNMGVGTASGTNTVSSATPLPATYTVDYAKAWR
jgi:beta-glucanase (GH16 family)